MRRAERSQAMTEFALVAPVLLLLTFGIMDFGRALYFYSAAGNAAREAARVATRASSPTMPTDADVLSAASAHFPGATVSAPGGCSNGPLPAGTPGAGSAWLFITEPNPVVGGAVETSPPANAPGGETPAAAGGCSAVNPAIGNQQLAISVVYNFVPATPLISSLVAGHLIFRLQVTFRTEY